MRRGRNFLEKSFSPAPPLQKLLEDFLVGFLRTSFLPYIGITRSNGVCQRNRQQTTTVRTLFSHSFHHSALLQEPQKRSVRRFRARSKTTFTDLGLNFGAYLLTSACKSAILTASTFEAYFPRYAAFSCKYWARDNVDFFILAHYTLFGLRLVMV